MRVGRYLQTLHEPVRRGPGENGRDPELVAHYRAWLMSHIGSGLVVALVAIAVVLGADTLIAAWSGP